MCAAGRGGPGTPLPPRGRGPHISGRSAGLSWDASLWSWSACGSSPLTARLDRASYEFAIASTAVALDMDGDTVRQARIGLGGMAYRPWRALAAEAALVGGQGEA